VRSTKRATVSVLQQRQQYCIENLRLCVVNCRTKNSNQNGTMHAAHCRVTGC